MASCRRDETQAARVHKEITNRSFPPPARNSGQISHIQQCIQTVHQAVLSIFSRIGPAPIPAASRIAHHVNGSFVFYLYRGWLLGILHSLTSRPTWSWTPNSGSLWRRYVLSVQRHAKKITTSIYKGPTTVTKWLISHNSHYLRQTKRSDCFTCRKQNRLRLYQSLHTLKKQGITRQTLFWLTSKFRGEGCLPINSFVNAINFCAVGEACFNDWIHSPRVRE